MKQLNRAFEVILHREGSFNDSSIVDVHSASHSGKVQRDGSTTLTHMDAIIEILHFKGSEDFHSMHEIFFYPQALYIVTWKLVSADDDALIDSIDKNISFWIELIFVRAPGANVLVVATHADLFSAGDIEKTIQNVERRLNSFKQVRKQELENRLKAARENCVDQHLLNDIEDEIKKMEDSVTRIIPVTCVEDTTVELQREVSAMSSLSSSSSLHEADNAYLALRAYTDSPSSPPAMTVTSSMTKLRDVILSLSPSGKSQLGDVELKIKQFLEVKKKANVRICRLEDIVEGLAGEVEEREVVAGLEYFSEIGDVRAPLLA